MAKDSVMNNPRCPHNQPFQIKGSKCKSKTNSWWNPSSTHYWRGKKNNTKSVNHQD